MPGDVIILHLCSSNDNHMIYGSWDMERNRLNFLSFWTIFCPFTSLTTWEIKILKKWRKKNACRYYHFIHVYHKWKSYDVYFQRYGTWQTNFFSFSTILCPFTPLTSQKNKILKKRKNTWIYHFTQVYQKSWSYTIPFLRHGAWQM